MSQIIQTLALLKKMRERSVSDLTSQLSQQKKICQGYQKNIDVLSALKDELSASGSANTPKLSPALMSNQSNYKSHLQKMIDWQKQEFVLADKQAQNIQQNLVKEACKEKTVDLVLSDKKQMLCSWQERQQQKITDGLSTQAWLRQQQSMKG